MKLVRKFENGKLKDLYIVDDEGNEIRGIVSANNSSLIELEIYEGNFNFLLRLMPAGSGAFLTQESLGKLADMLGSAAEKAGIHDAKDWVASCIEDILSEQGHLIITGKE